MVGMIKIKKKTQISAFVGQVLGEWLRDYAFEKRRTESSIVRDALRVYRLEKDKREVITGSAAYNTKKYQIEVEVERTKNDLFLFRILIYPTDGRLIPFAALISEEEIEDHVTENKSLSHLGKIMFKVVKKHLPKLLKMQKGGAWNINFWLREFGDKK